MMHAASRSLVRAGLIGILLSIVSAMPAGAIDTETPFNDPILDARYDKLIHELRCMVCLNGTIADSRVDLAADLRREVHRMVADGQTEDEIKTFMQQRYGDSILYNPPVQPNTWALWAAPTVFLLIGLAVVGRIVWQRRNLVVADESSLHEEDHA